MVHFILKIEFGKDMSFRCLFVGAVREPPLHNVRGPTFKKKAKERPSCWDPQTHPLPPSLANRGGEALLPFSLGREGAGG
jgi:hypothetical protein